MKPMNIMNKLNESIKDNLKGTYTNRQASEQSVIDEIVNYFTDYFKSDKYVNYIEKLCEERIKNGDKSKQFKLDFWGGYNSDAYFRAPGITWEKGTGYEKREYEGIELYKINFKVMEKVEQAFKSLLKQEGLNIINEKTGYNNPSLSDWYHKEIIVSLDDFLDEQVGDQITESVNGDNKCVLCGKQIKGWGNDAWPLADGYCCDKCNDEKVIPARIAQAYRSNEDNLKEENRYGKTEGDKYSYITYANNPDEIGAEYEYNSMANTEVIEMLDELKRYFTQAEKDAREIIANATHDPGIGNEDIEMCKFCAEKAQEMIDKMNSTWE